MKLSNKMCITTKKKQIAKAKIKKKKKRRNSILPSMNCTSSFLKLFWYSCFFFLLLSYIFFFNLCYSFYFFYHITRKYLPFQMPSLFIFMCILRLFFVQIKKYNKFFYSNKIVVKFSISSLSIFHSIIKVSVN